MAVTAASRTYGKGHRIYVSRPIASSIPYSTPQSVNANTMTRVGGIVSIDGINADREEVDATELDNIPDTLPSGGQDEQYYYKQKLPGDKNYEDLSAEVNLNEGMYLWLLDSFNRDELIGVELRLRSGAVGAFTGYIKSMKVKAESNQLMKLSISFTPANTVTWTEA